MNSATALPTTSTMRKENSSGRTEALSVARYESSETTRPMTSRKKSVSEKPESLNGKRVEDRVRRSREARNSRFGGNFQRDQRMNVETQNSTSRMTNPKSLC